MTGFVVLRAGARRVRRLLVLTGCVTLGVFGLGAVEARAATPSLAGESFSSTGGGSMSGTCTSDNNGSFSFSTSGYAFGPYPGSFIESGTFSIENGTLTAFSAHFGIGTFQGASVTGSKSLLTEGPADCQTETHLVRIVGNTSTDTYTATINGSIQDTGTAMNGYMEGNLPPAPDVEMFSEEFTTSNGFTSPPPPPPPQQKHHQQHHHHHHHRHED